MRVLLAPDKFKGTLTAPQAADAMRRGVERAGRALGIRVEIDECPVADGGEGTIDALAGVREARRVEVESADVMGIRRIVPVLLLVPRAPRFDRTRKKPPPSESSSEAADAAVIESASVIGLRLVPPGRRDPESIGTGALASLLRAAREQRPGRIVVGLGGSATVDGGVGLAAALGVEWIDERGDVLRPVAGSLANVRGIRRREAMEEWKASGLTALCDVMNPLLGPRGAARMFGPQKGATPEQVERLERGLENLVRVCRECGMACDPDAPGAGSAGGLGFGLATFLGARLVPGAAYVLDMVGFDERVAAADLVLTGEGKMDMQTAEGKACAEVARRAARAGRPCIAVVGTTEGEAEPLRAALADRGVRLESIVRLTDAAGTPDEARGRAAEALEEATSTVLHRFVSHRRT